MEPVQVFQGWMKVDGRIMKSALLNIIKKWSFMFKQHLIDHVTNRWVEVPPVLVHSAKQVNRGHAISTCLMSTAVKDVKSSRYIYFEYLFIRDHTVILFGHHETKTTPRKKVTSQIIETPTCFVVV